MNKAKINLILHVIGQIVAQSAVVEVVPSHYKPLFSAIVAIVGVLVAFSDQSLSN